MSKRLVSLLVLLVMLVGVILTSCSSSDEELAEDTAVVRDITLTFYGIKGAGTTDEAVSAVEAEINKYTEKNYHTTIELNLFEEDEYDEAMENVYLAIAEQKERNEREEELANEAAKAARAAAKKLSVEDQKEKKSSQREYEKWAEDNLTEEDTELSMKNDVSLDIFLIRGFEDYLLNVTNEKLADLSSYSTGTYKEINDYSSPIILQAAKRNGSLYAVPSNKALGVGENGTYYYALRTDLIDKYIQTEYLTDYRESRNSIPELSHFDSFFEQVKANDTCDAVILAPPTAMQGFDFYCNDPESFSIFGAANKEATATNVAYLDFVPGEKVIETDSSTVTASGYYKRIAAYRQAGYFAPDGAVAADTDFVFGVFQGTLEEVKAQLGDRADNYTYGVYKSAKTTNEEVFESMLAVSTECKYPDRAFQIISALHTVPKLRNLFTFGIQGANYEILYKNLRDEEATDNEIIKPIENSGYNIDFELYGNSLIGHIPDELGADYQTVSSKNNADVKVNAFLGYTIGLDSVDVEALEKMSKIGNKYLEQLMYGVPGGSEGADALLLQMKNEMGREENILNLYLDEKDGDEYQYPYISLLVSLNNDFPNFASTRATDRQVPNNDFLSNEVQKQIETAILERQLPVISQCEAEMDTETQALDAKTGLLYNKTTFEPIRNIFRDAAVAEAEAIVESRKNYYTFDETTGELFDKDGDVVRNIYDDYGYQPEEAE